MRLSIWTSYSIIWSLRTLMAKWLRIKSKIEEFLKSMEISIKNIGLILIFSLGNKNMLSWSVHKLQVEALIFLTSTTSFSSMFLLLLLTMAIGSADRLVLIVQEYLFSCFIISNLTMHKKLGFTVLNSRLFKKILFLTNFLNF